MPDHNYIAFGCQGEHDEETLDVFAKIRGEQPLNNVNIVLMPRLTMRTAQKIIAEMVREGLLAEHQENGELMYSLTEKGELMAEEAKRQLLEDANG